MTVNKIKGDFKMAEISQEKKQEIKNFLSSYNQSTFDLGYKTIPYYYFPDKNAYLLEINEYEDGKFIQEINLINVIDELKKVRPDVDSSKVYFLDYTGTILPGFEVLNINFDKVNFIYEKTDKHYKYFNDFKKDYINTK